MLTAYDEETVNKTDVAFPGSAKGTNEAGQAMTLSRAGKSRLARAMSVEWLGQTAASLCWIASVFSYGISSTGDWLQLSAASAWLLANIASIATAEAD